ncbi:hypothetical protein ACFQ88_00390 [Paenibacillus sp. NPDC056579]|uniref:hypothetical protein n=1 Tax=unclassified Paenibacillus TaxID=185978 RepID=UPI001EF75639|nr:hypothetical protein [Paenibacillus sp. H1-7]ULL15537.1 hypothetical protein DVH26_14435 [Paenibacillus sp. H1-7]
MKFGSFLLGGLVGAAAVIYINNKSKSMLFSAMSSNQSLGSSADRGRSNERSMDSSNQNKTKMNQTAASSLKKDEHSSSSLSSSSTLGKVEEIISQDPELKSTVNEILAENGQEEVYQKH